MAMTVQEYIRMKALGITGLIEEPIDPRTRDERLTFVNNINESIQNKLHEYGVWYSGDSEEILNYYSRAQVLDFNYDPIYSRNKKSYFWSVSATEQDIKRTHSGQPRNIVDTLVNIVGVPRIMVGSHGGPLDKVDDRLQEILRENHFPRLIAQRARPLTFVEGWGAWKINWDSDLSDSPILLYYRADAVDFVYSSGRLVAIIYKDYFQDEKKQDYVLFETRRLSKGSLYIEKELFRMFPSTDLIKKVPLSSLPQLRDVKESIEITNFKSFLGYPCIIYENSDGDTYGRSIFTGKIDLFDDLDQCLSQSANTVRRSTTMEYFDTMYLEKDEVTGMPKMPHSFDRKYVKYKGSTSGDGTLSGNSPVQVTQPALNFEQYSEEATSILLQIISGIMSPATLGIDVAKKDNAAAQREKEKVTIFTRNVVMREEGETLRRIANDLLCADEFMRTGKVTCRDYDVSVQYDEFADSSYENKLDSILKGWESGLVSDGTAIDYLYGDTWSKKRKDAELEWIAENRKENQKLPEAQGPIGAKLGGDNPYDDAMKNDEEPEMDPGQGV